MNQLMPAEVHAVIKSLSDLYVKEETGHGDLNITVERESDPGDGQTKALGRTSDRRHGRAAGLEQ